MTVSLDRQIVYPDRDGQPMSDNTKQFRWIVLLKENLECLFAGDAQVFVAGDLLWYPVEGHPEIRSAPDAMVVLGRPKGDRGSYKQWEEGNIAPQVVFEVLSPGNTLKEMAKKQEFYNRHGVEEYYLYDPDKNDLNGWLRGGDGFVVIDDITDWQSPRLGIRFVLTQETLEVYYPDGRRFLTTVELEAKRAEAEWQANQAKLELEATNLQLEATSLQLEEERSRSARLAEQLKTLGIDPDQI
ncbi:Uma2 family endonuclease [Alkalinema pantanalense CENA528]|uniref:Uma2 family endonuclease n=1 Tax=Alkalinema pantanalense TaxID=1620705 RepID=UPI003D6F75BF